MAMQESWLLGSGWDDEFPSDLKKTCQEWFSQLPELSGVQVPSCYRVAEQNCCRHLYPYYGGCIVVGLCSCKLRAA